jgi:uncharacterized protein YbjT (DUF2867 family)
MPKAFIPAISGQQSAAIAEQLRSGGWEVSGSRRSDAGDPRDGAEGARVMVLTIPQDHQPGAIAAFVDYWVKAARSRAVERIVLNTGATPGPAAVHPYFGDLHAAIEQVAQSGLAFCVLQPTIYLDNLATPMARDALGQGVIAWPTLAEALVSWVSHRTLGAWVCAVADGAADGRRLAIGGPEALTGERLAAAFGAVLGRELAYVTVPLGDFARGLNAALGAPAGDRLAAIYHWLADHPDYLAVDPAEAARLGVALESAGDFAARTVATS